VWNAAETAAVNARLVLPALAEKYFEAGRKLLLKESSHRALHRFRLKTKQFRYTLELFRDVYGASLERRLESLRPIQSALGDLNDCAAAIELLKDKLGNNRNDAAWTHVKAFLEKRAAKKTAEFERLWRNTFDAPGQSKAWVDLLARPQPTRKRSKP
ncbi:MAG: CHAD domain-containing protein, partial [Acidobacteriota bacterium]|nr:CHAD domain-containing protein [Acidobacteriota bacterium]